MAKCVWWNWVPNFVVKAHNYGPTYLLAIKQYLLNPPFSSMFFPFNPSFIGISQLASLMTPKGTRSWSGTAHCMFHGARLAGREGICLRRWSSSHGHTAAGADVLMSKKTSNHIIWFGGIKPASIGILQRYNEDTSGDIMVIWWGYNGTAMWYVPWSRWNIGVLVIHPISCYWIDLPFMGNQPMFWPWHIWVCLKITHPFYEQLMGNTVHDFTSHLLMIWESHPILALVQML